MKRSTLLGAATALILLAGGGRADPSSSLEYVPRIYEILSADWGASTSERQRLDLLVDLGPEAIPSICAILTGAVEADSDAEGSLKHNPAVRQENEILFQALQGMPTKPVLDFLRSIDDVDVPLGYRLVAMRVLSGTGDRRAVELWVRLLAPLEELELRSAYVQSACEGALADVLQADSYAYRDIVDHLDAVPLPVHPLIARAVGRAGRGDGLDVLQRLLGKSSELDLIVLDQVCEIGSGAPVWRLTHLVSSVRALLTDEDWRMRRAAAVAVARLHDVDSFPRLLELLEDDYRRVRQSALWGLQQMSEMPWSAEDVDQWQEWFDGQYMWWQENRGRLETELSSRDPGHVLAAIKALGDRRLFRHDVAYMIASVVDHPRESIATAACAAIERLGSQRVVPDLVAALERSDEGVRRAASQALHTLTGERLPPDAEAWAEYLRQ